MKRRIECNECAFYERNGYQDMGAHMDVCRANPNMWDFLERETCATEHCPYAYTKVKDALKKARERWKRDLEDAK